MPVVSGDAATPEVLIQAHAAWATILSIAIPVRPIFAKWSRSLRCSIRQSPSYCVLIIRKKQNFFEESLGIILLDKHILAHGMTLHILLHLKSYAKANLESAWDAPYAKSKGPA